MYPRDRFEPFVEQIEPYRELWNSLRVVSIAARKGDLWLNLATRMTFSEHPTNEPSEFAVTDYFSVFESWFPFMQGLEVVEETVLTDKIRHADGRFVFSFEPKADAGRQISWMPPRMVSSGNARREVGIERTCVILSAFGPRVTDHIPYEKFQRLDSAVRLQSSIFANVKSIVDWYTPGTSVEPNGGSTSVAVVAQIPLTVGFVHIDGIHGKLCVRGTANAFGESLFVLAFVDGGKVKYVPQAENTVEESRGFLRWEERFDWGIGSQGAAFHLYYKSEEVDQEVVPRWYPGWHLPGAVDEFFDPGGLKLREWLFTPKGTKRKGRSRQGDFERGVVRLLVRTGIPAVWYGHGYDERPDLAAVIDWTDPMTVLVGECTVENPGAKFSGLESVCREFQTQLGNDVRILPVVFTQVPATDSDRAAAIERGIIVVGQKELENLAMIRGFPKQAIKYLFSLAGPFLQGVPIT